MKSKTQKITTIAMLCAIAYIVTAVGRIPVVLFLKYDPSDTEFSLEPGRKNSRSRESISQKCLWTGRPALVSHTPVPVPRSPKTEIILMKH